ncbi:MAG: hypothetical protein AABX96_03955 [Nanoarchaeota archaeon]
MNKGHKNIHVVAGLIFGVVAVLHLSRILTGFQVIFGSVSIPMWVSWIGFVVATVLSYLFFKSV